MKAPFSTAFSIAAALALAIPGGGLAAPAAPPARPAAAAKTLKPFASEREFRRTLARLLGPSRPRVRYAPPAPVAEAAPVAAAAPAQAAANQGATLDRIQVTGSRVGSPDDAITNVQTQGVDEGDIVKKQGDYLIVLRRGRLFVLDTGGDRLRAVSSIDAYAPGSDPSDTWFDEMLVADGTVVVIGYSYDRGGTEIGLFDLRADGGLRHRATYQLRSSDYYSSRNYASRLIGKTLVFYAPMSLEDYEADRPDARLPALRQWRRGATPADFRRILPATAVYAAPGPLDPDDLALHAVTRCELGGPRMRCRSSAVLGADSRVFYVSEDAVYVWTARDPDPARPGRPNAAVLRIPLDGRAPSALRASGSPVDQMSFLQRDGWLNVLVGNDAEGEAMWAAHTGAGDLALLRVRLGEFGDGRGIARRDAYRPLPQADAYDLHARFIGDWLVFGSSGYPGDARGVDANVAYALRYARREAVSALRLTHPVERVDALGQDAILVGAGRDREAAASASALHFTSVRLGAAAHVAGHYAQADAAQGDDRTHGFFYRPEDADNGLLGLPAISGDGEARVLFLRNRRLGLSAAGALASSALAGQRRDDGCVASCVDWYGNARPIFAGQRVYALLGYELVEGRRDGDRIVERRRVDFSPQAKVSR